jgi:hypothetical protein
VCDLMNITAVGLHALSWHSIGTYNNANPGAYVRDDCGIQAGAYYNSERKFTAYVAKVFDWQPIKQASWFGVFASVGLATGYEQATVLPIALGGINIRYENYGLRVGYAPKLKGVNDTHLIHFAFEIDIDG